MNPVQSATPQLESIWVALTPFTKNVGVPYTWREIPVFLPLEQTSELGN